MHALCMTVSNPFDPAGSRAIVPVRQRRRIRALAPRTHRPHMALLNGQPILRAAWGRKLCDGDMLTFVVLPQGGGGGGSNPLRTVLSIALLAFAGPAATALLGAELAATTLIGSYTLGQATAVGLVFAGNALINAALPLPAAPQIEAPSPTYSLSAQGNTARIDQAIPVQYGSVRSWPDLAAQPYTEFAGDDQYLYQLLCLGQGEYDIEDILIEDTPIAAFEEIETEIVGPGEAVTLFPTNVITSVEVSGQELQGRTAPTYTRAGTTVIFTETAHSRLIGDTLAVTFVGGAGQDGVYQITAVPTSDTFVVTLPASSGPTAGTAYVSSVLGGINGFVANGAGTLATRLGVDFVLPRGLFNLDANGDLDPRSITAVVEARQIDEDGEPSGAWVQLEEITFEDRSATPLRISKSWATPGWGRFAVRMWRVDEQTTSPSDGHEIVAAGLRAYLREDHDYGDLTLIALRMRATNNLSAQASRRVSVISTRKLPVWDGTSWSAPQPTSSIAWAIADAARNAAYGAGLSDAKVDLAGLLALDAIWQSRGDELNGRIDQAATWWDVVSRMAAVGRAKPYFQGGILRVVRDGPQSVPVALYSMRNIKAGSFNIDYLMPSDETADTVEVIYFDRSTWTSRKATAALPNSTGARKVRLEMPLITDRSHAWREGMYHAAANRYRRRMVRFETEMEGFIPSLGDLIAIQHDTPGWAHHAEATYWNEASGELHLSEPVTFGEDAHYIGLRRPDGSVSGPWLVTPGDDATIVVLAQTPDFDPSPAQDRERTQVVFGPGNRWRANAKVLSAAPRGMRDVEIEAVIENDGVHIAEAGGQPQPLNLSLLDRSTTRPVIRGLIARTVPDDETRVLVSWFPAPGAQTYQIEMAHGSDLDDDNLTWTGAGTTSANSIVLRLLYARQTLIRVRGIGLAAGDYATANIGSVITPMWSSASAAMWSNDNTLMWSAS